MAAPGVAAQHPPDGLGQPLREAVLAECQDGVLAAGGLEAAHRREEGGEETPVKPEQADEGGDENPPQDGDRRRGVYGR